MTYEKRIKGGIDWLLISILTIKVLEGETHQCDCGDVGEDPEDGQAPEDSPVVVVEYGYSEKEHPIGDAEAQDCYIGCGSE